MGEEGRGGEVVVSRSPDSREMQDALSPAGAPHYLSPASPVHLPLAACPAMSQPPPFDSHIVGAEVREFSVPWGRGDMVPPFSLFHTPFPAASPFSVSPNPGCFSRLGSNSASSLNPSLAPSLRYSFPPLKH